MATERSIETIRKETKTLSAEEIRGLLTHPTTNDRISEGLGRTNKEGTRFAGQLLGKEFGYVTFGDLTQGNRKFHFTDLLEGQEGSINLRELSNLILNLK